MTLWFVMGTAAELIKVYPLIVEAQKRKIDWYVLTTGQSGLNFWRQYDDFNLPRAKALEFLSSKEDLKSSQKAAVWFFKMLPKSGNNLRAQIIKSFGRTPSSSDYWFVHGDTFSTLIGAIYGRRLSVPVVHVEAGMRSGHVLSPFPEEINRRIVSRISGYHMAPDKNAADNLKKEGIANNVFITNGNTVLDSLNVTIEQPKPVDLPKEQYVVANFHRFENLSSQQKWKSIIHATIQTAKKWPVYFVLQPNARYKLEEDQSSKTALKEAGVFLVDRMPFSKFMHFMHKSEFVISDGGSNQQECYYLGKPCLIMRDRTESIEGIGTTCVISEFKQDIIDNFLGNPLQFRYNPIKPTKRPTDIIFESLGI